MRTPFLIVLTVASLQATVGCGSGNGPAYGEDVTAKIKAMPAEERWKLIRDNPGLSPQMKTKAIDDLPATDTQKQQWKFEVGGAAANGAAPPSGAGR